MSFDLNVTESCVDSILVEPAQSINEIVSNDSYGGDNHNQGYSNTLQIDTSQAQQQLRLLGYGENDPIYLRELPRKGDKGSPRNITCTMATLPTTQQADKALYLVVNGQGHTKSEITYGRALMFESDDSNLTREQHEKIWQKLGTDKIPTFQVETRHSVHTYHVYSDPPNIKDWCELQSDCNEYLDTDRKIKDAPRLMRLAGALHTEIDKETGEVLEPVRCELINVTGNKYDYQELRDIVPSAKPKAKSTAKPKPVKNTHSTHTIDFNGQKPSDYVDQAKKLLGTTLYESILVDDHGRCNCPFHESTSGNSAWVREYPDGSGYHFNCPTCTDMGGRESINTFEFWLWQKYGKNTPNPKGKEYIKDAKEFCLLAGIEIPESTYTKNSPQSNPIAQSISKELSLGDRLTELLKKDSKPEELIKAIIELSKDISDPIGELKKWIECNLAETPEAKLYKAIKLIGAVNSEYGDKVTKLSIAKAIQAYSPLVCGKQLLTNLKDINGALDDGAKVANPPKNDKQKAIEITAQMYPSLRFNLLTGKAESNGTELKKIELAYLKPELVADEIGKNLAADAILVNAHKNEYHPVKDYLELTKNAPLLSPDQWDNLAFYLLGTSDQLAQIVLKKALIATVARIYKPGCYVRMIPVLQGEQNAGKSTFLRLLAGDEFFSDSLGKLDNPKDDYQLLHSYWIHEWGEIDKLSKKSAGEVKAFITKTKDDFRAPYARSPETHQRQCVIFGSCNRRDFLKDSTGNTRFSVIEVGKINLELLKQWRDSIWGTALARFEAGEQWELTQAEQALSEVNNQAYSELDPWHEDIESFLSIYEEISINRILDHLGIEINKKDSLSNKRVRDVLTTLGWVKDKNPTNYQGQRTRVWRSPLAQPDTARHSEKGGCVSAVSGVVSDETLINQGLQHLDTTDTAKNTQLFYLKTPQCSEQLPPTHPQADTHSGEFRGKSIGENSCVSCVSTPQAQSGQGVEPDTALTQYRHSDTAKPDTTPLKIAEIQKLGIDQKIHCVYPSELIDETCLLFWSDDTRIKIGGADHKWSMVIPLADIESGAAKIYQSA